MPASRVWGGRILSSSLAWTSRWIWNSLTLIMKGFLLLLFLALVCLFVLETGSYCVDQAGLKITVSHLTLEAYPPHPGKILFLKNKQTNRQNKTRKLHQSVASNSQRFHYLVILSSPSVLETSGVDGVSSYAWFILPLEVYTFWVSALGLSGALDSPWTSSPSLCPMRADHKTQGNLVRPRPTEHQPAVPFLPSVVQPQNLLFLANS